MKSFLFWLAYFCAYALAIWRHGCDQGEHAAHKAIRKKEANSA